MNKAGAAIKKSVDSAGKKINEAESKQSSKSSKAGKSDAGKPDVGERLQTGAKDALKKVEAEADKAEHAIVTTVKDMGKKGADKSKNSATKSSGGKSATETKGPSLDQSMKEFGKNAEKAGTAMENGVKKLGSDAKREVEKADQAIKKKTEHK